MPAVADMSAADTAAVELLVERVVDSLQRTHGRQSRWLVQGNNKRMGWQVTDYAHSKVTKDVYLMPDGRIAIVEIGRTKGTKDSPHQARILTVSSLCASRDAADQAALQTLIQELRRRQPRPPGILGFRRRS